jgi:hypothetical protein
MTGVCRQSCSLASFPRGQQDWLTGLLSAWSCSGNVVGFNSNDDLRLSACSAHSRCFHRVTTRLQIRPFSPSCNSRRHIWRPVEHVRALALLALGSYSHTPHIPVIPRQRRQPLAATFGRQYIAFEDNTGIKVGSDVWISTCIGICVTSSCHYNDCSLSPWSKNASACVGRQRCACVIVIVEEKGYPQEGEYSLL